MACDNCVQRRPIKKDDSACKGSKPKIEDVRFACCDDLVETISASPNGDCSVGYISDLVSADPIGNPEPIVSVDITNAQDLDELNDYTYDRAEDTGEDTFSITLGIRTYTPDDDCTLNSMKGQDICVYYKISNKTGDWIWRRFSGKVTGITAGLLGGYQVTIDNVDPDDADRPLYVNFSTGAATTTAMNLLTTFN